MPTRDSASNPLDLPIVRKRVRKRDAIKGPRRGDWVIMLDGSFARLSSDGIGEVTSWINKDRPWPIDAIPNRKDPDNRIDHPCFVTDRYYQSRESGGNFFVNRDGTISHSGGNDLRAALDAQGKLDSLLKYGKARTYRMATAILEGDQERQGVAFEKSSERRQAKQRKEIESDAVD